MVATRTAAYLHAGATGAAYLWNQGEVNRSSDRNVWECSAGCRLDPERASEQMADKSGDVRCLFSRQGADERIFGGTNDFVRCKDA